MEARRRAEAAEHGCLSFRRLIEDPFDLAARPVLLSINTLTLRRDPIEGHQMFLHRRNASAARSG